MKNISGLFIFCPRCPICHHNQLLFAVCLFPIQAAIAKQPFKGHLFSYLISPDFLLPPTGSLKNQYLSLPLTLPLENSPLIFYTAFFTLLVHSEPEPLSPHPYHFLTNTLLFCLKMEAQVHSEHH